MVLWVFIISLVLSVVYMIVDYNYEWRYNEIVRRIIKSVILIILLVTSLWVALEHGVNWDANTPHAQLSFISTMALIGLRIIVIGINWLDKEDERRDEERTYQKSLKQMGREEKASQLRREEMERIRIYLLIEKIIFKKPSCSSCETYSSSSSSSSTAASTIMG